MIEAIIDFSSKMGEARDQGRRPTCLVFAGSDLNAAANDVSHLSAEFLCHHAVRAASDWTPARGFQMDEVLGAVSSPGQPLEKTYPYKHDDPEAPLVVPSGEFSLHTSRVSRHPDMQCGEIVARALSGQPVGVVIQIARSVFTPSNGVINFDPFVLPDQYHALIVVGVGVQSNSADQYLLLRNSWGTAWGVNGHAWISVTHLNLLLLEGFLI